MFSKVFKQAKGGIIILTIAGIFIMAAFFVSAFGAKSTHPALTEEIAKFYNLSFDDRLTNQEIEWMKQGSIDEDTPPRWINHFYDPTIGEGWKAENMGEVSPEFLMGFSRLALANKKPISSKQWAKDKYAQSDYSSYGGDHTWQRAIKDYVSGDQKRAYYSLGHILHLIQDASVPAHTRNDTHAPFGGDKGSPLEIWAEEYTKNRQLQIADGLKQADEKPVIFNNLDAYFDFTASYSNKYFFSEDTIQTSKYKLPSVISYQEDDDYLYAYGIVNNEMMILFKIPKEKKHEPSFATTNDPQILSAYFSRLSRRAVIAGAGIIKLFKDEVKKAENNREFFERQPELSLLGQIRALGRKVVSPLGEAAKVKKAGEVILAFGQDWIAPLVKGRAEPETQITTEEELITADEESITADDEEQITADDEEQITADEGESVPSPQALLPQESALGESFVVAYVLDGDTIRLSNGQDVRLIGMNTPEQDENFYTEARNKMIELVLGRRVTLAQDVSETDKYKRLLRYVYVGAAEFGNETFVNLEMIRRGYADHFPYPPDTKYASLFKLAQEEAQAACLGKWAKRCLRQENQTVLNQQSADQTDENSPTPALPDGFDHTPEQTLLSDSPSEESSHDGSVYGARVLDRVQEGSLPEESLPENGEEDDEEEGDEEEEGEEEESDEEEGEEDKYILISEIQLSGPGGAKDEFIELYNSTSTDMNISGWSIQYRGSASENFQKKNFEPNSSIPGYGFFLIANHSYTGTTTPDMSHNSFSLSGVGGTVFLVFNHVPLASSTLESVADKVAYGLGDYLFPETQEADITNLLSGGSMERKASASSTPESMGTGGSEEQRGNGQDTNHNFNDFLIQEISNPQNSQSALEIMDRSGPGGEESDEEESDDEENNEEGEEDDDEEGDEDGDDDEENEDDGESDEEGEEDGEEEDDEEGEEDGQGEEEEGEGEEEDDEEPPEPIWPPLSGTEVPYPRAGQVLTMLAEGNPYYVDGDDWKIPANSKVIIEPGVIIKFGPRYRDGWFDWPTHLVLNGSLEVNGTQSNPVVFTSWKDDQYGGDSNGDGSASSPAPLDWGSIVIQSKSGEMVTFNYALILYGGDSGDARNLEGGAIYNRGSVSVSILNSIISYSKSGVNYSPFPGMPMQPMSIQNSEISYNLVWGVTLQSDNLITAPVTLMGNTIAQNGVEGNSGTTGGVQVLAPPFANPQIPDTGEVILKNNSIGQNRNNIYGGDIYGLYFYTTRDKTLDAQENFWGDETGPYHPLTNPTGLGDRVSDNVDYDGWLTG